MKRIVMTLAASAVLALSGCGGGGDSSSDSGGTPPPPQQVINQASAKQIAAIAVGASSAGFESAFLSANAFGQLGVIVAPPAPMALGVATSPAAGRSATGIALTYLEKFRRGEFAGSADLPVGVEISETVPCEAGSISYTANVQNPDLAPLPGDSLSIVFSNCQAMGETTNGRLSFVVGTLSETGFSASFIFDNLVTNDGTGPIAINGAFQFALTAQSETRFSFEINASSLSTTEGGVTTTLTGYTALIVVDADTYSYTINGTITEGEVSLIIATTEPFTGTFTQTGETAYPSTGKMTVTASDGSVMLVEVLSDTTVKITVGGQSQTFTWAELDAA